LIETIFTPKFAIGAELRKPPPCISRWGPAQLSAIEAQLIPGGLASKTAMGEGGWLLPLNIFGLGISPIGNSCRTIEHN